MKMLFGLQEITALNLLSYHPESACLLGQSMGAESIREALSDHGDHIEARAVVFPSQCVLDVLQSLMVVRMANTD